jgi:membrane associated rhomboid family serine protease
MIPVRDSIRSRRFPIVTVTLIVINILVFFYQSALSSPELQMFVMRYGVVPVQFALLPRFLFGGKLDFALLTLRTLVSATFLHGGLLHLGGNMLYLWVFGDNIEDRLGRWRYLAFYLTTGAVASVAHIISDPASTLPLIGASGAIAGVLGAYFVTFPRSRVLALVPLFFFLHFAEVPAVIFLAFWFVLQLVYGLGSLAPGSADMVAWWAHVGGFAAGVLLMRLFDRGPRRQGWPPGGLHDTPRQEPPLQRRITRRFYY